MVAYLQAALWWGLPLVGPPLQGLQPLPHPLQAGDHHCLVLLDVAVVHIYSSSSNLFAPTDWTEGWDGI